jgi:hypothetical protein
VQHAVIGRTVRDIGFKAQQGQLGARTFGIADFAEGADLQIVDVFSSPLSAAALAAGTGATLAAAGVVAGLLLSTTGACADAGAGAAGAAGATAPWILSTTDCSGSAAGAFGVSLAKSRAASRAASLLPYIGLFGSASVPPSVPPSCCCGPCR